MRLRILEIIILICFLSLLLGLSYTQVIRSHYYLELSRKNSIRVIPQSAMRGNIFDRKGRILATSRMSFDLSLIPQGLSKKNHIFLRLAQILAEDPSDLSKAYQKGYGLAFAPVVIKQDISRDEAVAIENNSLELDGVIIQQDPQRAYPNFKIASHILGYLGKIDPFKLTRLKNYGYSVKDTVGCDGIEEKLDAYLRAEGGGTQIEVDNLGRQVRVLGTKLPQRGKDVQLTIDLDLERICYNLLEGKTGAIIVMDPTSAEILSLVSSPGFDPNIFSQKNRDSLARRRLILNNSDAPLLNRAISGRYSAGSLFKIVTSLAGLSTKKISKNTNFLCTGGLIVGQRKFSCWSVHGDENIEDALCHSCNAFFYRLGILAGPDAIYNWATKLGFGRPTGIELPNESSGFIPSRRWRLSSRGEHWYDGDTANLSIGQGEVLVSPLQMVRMIAVVANGGYLITPHIIRTVDNKALVRPLPINLGLDKSILATVKSGLLRVVEDSRGTANCLKFDNLKIAGKTATAQVGSGKPHAWFSGFFPFENPRYVFVVLLEHGGGSQAAVTLSRQLIEEMIKGGFIAN
ncbi:MAG: penicillin-binding protein 2 [Candidatus Omnitrophota bacterium]